MLRRKKEFLTFLVKDLAPFAVGLVFLLASGVYCFFVLLNPKTPPEMQRNAWSAFMMLLTGVVGFVFGKAAGK